MAYQRSQIASRFSRNTARFSQSREGGGGLPTKKMKLFSLFFELRPAETVVEGGTPKELHPPIPNHPKPKPNTHDPRPRKCYLHDGDHTAVSRYEELGLERQAGLCRRCDRG